jgi:hypothetical protein
MAGDTKCSGGLPITFSIRPPHRSKNSAQSCDRANQHQHGQRDHKDQTSSYIMQYGDHIGSLLLARTTKLGYEDPAILFSIAYVGSNTAEDNHRYSRFSCQPRSRESEKTMQLKEGEAARLRFVEVLFAV